VKGGARARSGPPPDPNALRRDRPGDKPWTPLPAEGRAGPPPEWPLLGVDAHIDTLTKAAGKDAAKLMVVERVAEQIHDRELALWAREWRRPQAVEWERNGQEVEVALYVRAVVVAERGNAATSLRNLVRQYQEALGISLPGLARNHWRIEEAKDDANAPPGPSSRAAKPKDKGKAKSARERFEVLDGGGEGEGA
jgi:hypothetical protein